MGSKHTFFNKKKPQTGKGSIYSVLFFSDYNWVSSNLHVVVITTWPKVRWRHLYATQRQHINVEVTVYLLVSLISCGSEFLKSVFTPCLSNWWFAILCSLCFVIYYISVHNLYIISSISCTNCNNHLPCVSASSLLFPNLGLFVFSCLVHLVKFLYMWQ